MEKLLEKITSFDDVLSPRDEKQAQDLYDDLAQTREGQLEILEDAKNKIIPAIDYLYFKNKAKFAKIFVKYFVGDLKYFRKKVQNNEDAEFAHECYAMLAGESQAANPLKSFNAEKVSDLMPLPAFSYYAGKYAQSLAFQMIRSQNNSGMTQVGDVKNVSSSLDQRIELYGEEAAEAAIDKSFSDFEQKETVKAFIKTLNTKLKDLFLFILDNPTATKEETAEKVGLSRPTVDKRIDELKNSWTKFTQ